MKKEDIKSDELKRVIALTLGVFDFEDIKDEDLTEIKELVIRGTKLNGLKTDIDLSELKEFEQLRKLVLNGFNFSEDDFENILGLNLLDMLQLANCTFENKEFTLEHNSLSYLSISDSKGLENIQIVAPEVLVILGCDIDFSKIDISKTERIYMRDCIIKNFDDLKTKEKLKYINLDGSTVYDKDGNKLKMIDVNEEVEVSFEEEFLRIEFDKE